MLCSGGQRLYFVIVSDAPASAWGLRVGDALTPGDGGAAGAAVGAYLGFAAGGAPVLRVGISFVSVEQAAANIAAGPAATTSIEAVAAAADGAWEAELGAIRVGADGAAAADLAKFYSLWYASLAAPTTWSEAGGAYHSIAYHSIA